MNNTTSTQTASLSPLCSIVTVVKDDVVGLEKTLTSICQQTIATSMIDIIVVDGGLLEESQNIVATHISTFSHDVQHIRKCDTGIYDAMNTGISCACGEWILFLNTGDVFSDNDALQVFYEKVLHNNPSLHNTYAYIALDFFEKLLGHVVYKSKLSHTALPYAMPTSHQALFVRNAIARRYCFDTSYSICADVHQIMRVIQDGYSIYFYNMAITCVDATGFSTKNFSRMMKEKQRVQRDLCPTVTARIRMDVFITTCYIKRFIRACMPQKLQNTLRNVKHNHTTHNAYDSAITACKAKKKLLWLTTALDDSAVSKIFFLIAPHLQKKYEITFIALARFENKNACIRVQNMGITTDTLTCTTWQMHKAAQRLCAYLTTRPHDIVHAHLGRAYIVAALTKRLMSKVSLSHLTLLATFHNTFSYFSRMTRMGLAVLLHHFDGVSAVSSTCLTTYNRILHTKKCSHIAARHIYNPVENTLALSNPYSTPSDTTPYPIILCASRLAAHKGHEYIIAMMQLLRKHYAQTTVFFAGGGPMKQHFIALAEKHGVGDAVWFLGHVDTIHDYMKHADVVVFPSQSEGFGLVPCEAFLQDTPVVMQDSSLARELFVCDRWFVDCKNASAFCERVQTIIKDPYETQRYIEEEKKHIQTAFAPHVIACEYDAWFSSSTLSDKTISTHS